MNALHEQIEKARKRVRYLKRVTPEIFPEWQNMENAKRRLVKAKEELADAKHKWKKLGSKA